jgi:hypothetical protein
MQTRFRLGFVLSILAFACGSSGGSPPTDTETGTPSPVAAPTQSPTPRFGSDSGVAPIEVHGVVRGWSGKAIAGRSVLIADAVGNVFSSASDAAGSFVIANVVPPYDLRVFGPVGVSGTIFLGARATNVVTEADENPGGPTPTRPPPAKLEMTLNLPQCPTRSCNIEISATSPHGHAAVAAGYLAANRTWTYELPHSYDWEGVSEVADVHVLVSDLTFSQYWYARVSASVQPGVATNVNITPASVNTFGPITVSANDDGISATWRRDLNLWAVVSGVSLQLGRVDARSLVVRVPNIPGAELSGSFSAYSVAGAGEPSWAMESASGWSGRLPLLAPAVDMDAHLSGSAMVVPQRNGSVSSTTLAYSWTSEHPGSACWVVTGAVGDLSAPSIITADRTVELARIEKLGVPSRVPGKYRFDLYCPPPETVDDILARGHMSYDDNKPGHAWYERFQFEVTR